MHYNGVNCGAKNHPNIPSVDDIIVEVDLMIKILSMVDHHVNTLVNTRQIN